MRIQDGKFDRQNGSALILVVVVTVLLAVVGVMFLMVSRASELETAAVIQSKDLDNGIDTVVARINEVLVQDLFGNDDQIVNDDSSGFDEPYDSSSSDLWLGDLEPFFMSPTALLWRRTTGLWGVDFNPIWRVNLGDFNIDKFWMPPASAGNFLFADADGDGVKDCRWVQIPGVTSSRGEPIFAAVRIVDNCAMLNLNGAHCFYQEPFSNNPLFEDSAGDAVSPFTKGWFESSVEFNDFVSDQAAGFDVFKQYLYHKNHETGSGRYITEINYLPFLRGNDLSVEANWYRIQYAKGFGDINSPVSPRLTHDILMNIENPMAGVYYFDIGDEIEIRNRYLLTSKTQAHFEHADVANFSLDAGGEVYGALKVPREDKIDSDGLLNYYKWVLRVDPANFDGWDMDGNPIPVLAPDLRYRYDRRHVSTFYSYDRNLRTGQYLLLEADFANLEATKGWTSEQARMARKIFWPSGPVTTNIKNADSLQPYNNLETRRRILHLLFAFREYFYEQNGNDLAAAAKSAAQVVANIIDYSDDDAIHPTAANRQGPFHDAPYGQQANVDCTFITEDIIQDMIVELSTYHLGAGNSFTLSFGLDPDPAIGIVFGYEKQPFISEVYARRDNTGALLEFAIELINPYSDDLPLVRNKIPSDLAEDAWKIKVADGSDINDEIAGIGSFIPAYDETTKEFGRYVIRTDNTVALAAGSTALTYELNSLINMGAGNYAIQLLRPAPKWVLDNLGIGYIAVDVVSRDVVEDLWNDDGQNAVKRFDDSWQFIYANDTRYELQDDIANPYSHTLGMANNVTTISQKEDFQIGVADDQLGLCRWHELEVLGLYGNEPESSDPNVLPQTVSSTLTDPNTSIHYFDLAGTSSGLLDYVATINRPELGTLPGRININTAPVHVIAAAIPPTLADPNAANPAEVVAMSSLQLAQKIVRYRPYQKLSDLLNIPEFKQYDDSGSGSWAGENVGMQSIQDDIEEEHWILSNLANKFTVRSDTFTAYILVRLGADGPQRRMIGIFDRSQVWKNTDRPKLVALHPVPDPR